MYIYLLRPIAAVLRPSCAPRFNILNTYKRRARAGSSAPGELIMRRGGGTYIISHTSGVYSVSVGSEIPFRRVRSRRRIIRDRSATVSTGTTTDRTFRNRTVNGLSDAKRARDAISKRTNLVSLDPNLGLKIDRSFANFHEIY